MSESEVRRTRTSFMFSTECERDEFALYSVDEDVLMLPVKQPY